MEHMLPNQSSYSRQDRIRDIINDNSNLLIVLNRFGMSLGFGDSTVEQVCRDNDVDMDTFLAVMNFVSGKRWEMYNISLMSLVGYLRRSHTHFIKYALPSIKKTLIEGIHQSSTSEISILIMNFYDTYVDEVRKHMEYEDEVIFTYVENLIAGNTTGKFRISEFSSRHEHVSGKLNDLKELFVYQYNQPNNELINTALLNIMMCGADLVSHCEIENKLLFPNISLLEQEVGNQRRAEGTAEQVVPKAVEMLSDREKEVIVGVASGLSNKEIADNLCLSFHTVTTYRRNISDKLNIHSTAALVIFAIVNKLVDINDVKMGVD